LLFFFFFVLVLTFFCVVKEQGGGHGLVKWGGVGGRDGNMDIKLNNPMYRVLPIQFG